jgi:hypothetical protein
MLARVHARIPREQTPVLDLVFNVVKIFTPATGPGLNQRFGLGFARETVHGLWRDVATAGPQRRPGSFCLFFNDLAAKYCVMGMACIHPPFNCVQHNSLDKPGLSQAENPRV